MKNEEATIAINYKRLKISSTAFAENDLIPAKYTCDGENISPPLDVEHIPAEAKCLVLIVDDPDAPSKTWVHWIIWNMPVTHHIKENEVHGVEGINDFRQYHYGGPCPPAGTHRYFFKVYALSNLLDLPGSADKMQLEKAMSEYIVGFGEMIGLYSSKY
jgi:Raf kinase inhibitor-like YbhB/YbcL family protein